MLLSDQTGEQLCILNFKTHPIELLLGNVRRVVHRRYPPNRTVSEPFEKKSGLNVAKEVDSDHWDSQKVLS